MMKPLAFVCSIALILASASAASAQQLAKTVKDLYAAAAYEDALAAVDRGEATVEPEIEQYRVYSLTALGRKDEAQKVMERLLQADPTYVLDPIETPPRVQEAFEAVRQRMLPALAKQVYLDARGALERKERTEAIARFEKLMKIIDAAGPAATSVADLRILADGFLELSRALPASAPPAPEPPALPPAAVAAAAAAPAPAETGPVMETRPIPIRQELPPWVPADAFSRRRTFTGTVRVRIGTDGRVEDAQILRASHPSYDQLLLRAAKNWQYEPAKRNEVAIVSELNVEVNLQPPQE